MSTYSIAELEQMERHSERRIHAEDFQQRHGADWRSPAGQAVAAEARLAAERRYPSPALAREVNAAADAQALDARLAEVDRQFGPVLFKAHAAGQVSRFEGAKQ